MSSKSAPSNSRAPFLSSGAMRWGWLSIFLVVLLEVYLWTKGGDQSFVKAFQFHVYAFSGMVCSVLLHMKHARASVVIHCGKECSIMYMQQKNLLHTNGWGWDAMEVLIGVKT